MTHHDYQDDLDVYTTEKFFAWLPFVLKGKFRWLCVVEVRALLHTDPSRPYVLTKEYLEII